VPALSSFFPEKKRRDSYFEVVKSFAFHLNPFGVKHRQAIFNIPSTQTEHTTLAERDQTLKNIMLLPPFVRGFCAARPQHKS
jgi:hypothetical protein